MKLIKLLFLAYFIVVLISCSNSSIQPSLKKFSLSGTTNNIPDGTMIYVLDILTNQVIDSVTIRENQFQITRDLSVSPTHLFLHNKDYSESKSIWVENNAMTFDASTYSFGDAKITGSETQLLFDLFMKQTATIESEEKIEEIAMEFVKKYPDSRFCASILAGYAPNWNKEKVKELYEGLSKENQASVYGLQIAKFIDLNRNHEIGDKYTDFEMKNERGEVLRLSENLGRVTLLEFWASWCGPCRQQNPDLVETYKHYKDAGFKIFSVSLDFSKEDWEKAIKKDRITWPQVSDLKGRNSTAGIIYGVNAIPDNFLIDADGNIIAKYLWGEPLNEAVEQALKSK